MYNGIRSSIPNSNYIVIIKSFTLPLLETNLEYPNTSPFSVSVHFKN